MTLVWFRFRQNRVWAAGEILEEDFGPAAGCLHRINSSQCTSSFNRGTVYSYKIHILVSPWPSQWGGLFPRIITGVRRALWGHRQTGVHAMFLCIPDVSAYSCFILPYLEVPWYVFWCFLVKGPKDNRHSNDDMRSSYMPVLHKSIVNKKISDKIHKIIPFWNFAEYWGGGVMVRYGALTKRDVPLSRPPHLQLWLDKILSDNTILV